MLRKLREARDEEGFTLIELLVVVIIIGILAAIAIPVFLNQRQKAWDTAAKSDVKNMSTAEETYLTDSSPAAYTSNVTDLEANGFSKSDSVLHCAVANGGTSYQVVANHTSSPNTWVFDSSTGQLDISTSPPCTPA